MHLSLHPFDISPKPSTSALLFAFGVIFTLIYTILGGTPPPERLPLFILGVGIVFAVISIILAVGWHLLARPLPQGVTIPKNAVLPNWIRVLLAVLVVIISFNNFAGSSWDEAWHHQYGIPFGEDFLWPPHMLIYTFFGGISMIAFLGWFLLTFRSKGTMQQRFRANPVVGLLVLIGGFVLFALPADPLWHSLYGIDITAWSLPHILLLWASGAAILLGPMLLMTTIATRQWAGIKHISVKDVLMTASYAFILGTFLIVLTTEWDSLATMPTDQQYSVMARPDWMLTTTIVVLAAFIATLALHTTKRIGSATLVGVIGFTVRVALIRLVNNPNLSGDAWFIALVVMILIDALYSLRLVRGNEPSWVWSGMAAAVGLSLTLPMFNQLFLYPVLDSSNVPMIILTSLLAGFLGSWAGKSVADLISQKSSAETTESREILILRLLTPVTFLLLILFVSYWITIAPPPV